MPAVENSNNLSIYAVAREITFLGWGMILHVLEHGKREHFILEEILW
jgi:hypothetical protein